MRRALALLLPTLLLGGCQVFGPSPEETLAATLDEVEAVLDGAVAAVDLPVTRRVEREDAFLLPCDGGRHRVSMKVNADDPPDLEGLHVGLVAHLEAEGWTITGDLPARSAEGRENLSVFLARDGLEAIVDLVRGSEGTGVDLEVLSDCRRVR